MLCKGAFLFFRTNFHQLIFFFKLSIFFLGDFLVVKLEKRIKIFLILDGVPTGNKKYLKKIYFHILFIAIFG
jgi:hypothetical protein